MSLPFQIDEVLDMQGHKVQFAHVAKHMYRPREAWEQVHPEMTSARRRALGAGCRQFELKAPYPSYREAEEGCRERVLRDHDVLLAPAYRDALREAAAAGRYGKLIDDRNGWAFVGDAGVLVIVRLVDQPRRPEVKTAYRVVPRGPEPELRDFFEAAVRKLRVKTSWKGGSS